MTPRPSTYRLNVAGGLRVATGPLALIAANVAALTARGYRVWVRGPHGAVAAIESRGGELHTNFHPVAGAGTAPPAWVARLSELTSELSNNPTNQKRSSTE